MSVEVGEQVRNAEVLQAGGVVGHAIGRAVDVGNLFAVAVVPLVDAAGPAEVGAGGSGRDGAFVLAGQGRGVVGEAG